MAGLNINELNFQSQNIFSQRFCCYLTFIVSFSFIFQTTKFSMQKVSNLMYFGKIALLLANQNQENVLMHIISEVK